jgi:TM2 domain-containing membrane protein YozV
VEQTDEACPHCRRGLTARALLENPPGAPISTPTAFANAAESSPGMKRCPYCAEEIQAAAIVCRYCQRALTAGAVAAHAQTMSAVWSPGVAAVLSLVIPGAGQMYKGQIGRGIAFLVGAVLGYMMLVLPGLVVHLFAIIDAANARPPARVSV